MRELLTAIAIVAAGAATELLLPASGPAVAIGPLGIAALGSTALSGIGMLTGGDDTEKARQARNDLLRRQLQLAEETFRQRAPLRNLGLAGIGRFMAGRPTPSVFFGGQRGQGQDVLGLLGQLGGGLQATPQRGSQLFPRSQPEVDPGQLSEILSQIPERLPGGGRGGPIRDPRGGRSRSRTGDRRF